MDARRGRLSRRSLLADAGVLGALSVVGCRPAAREAPKAENPGPPISRASRLEAAGDPRATARETHPKHADALDEALERLASRGPAYSGGLANHAPMVAEALVMLDRGDAISSWIDTYAPRLEAWPRSGGRIAQNGWTDALGKSERATDWREFFVAELASAPVREVLAVWVPRLGAGISGSAAHGVIRVGHVARALAVRETAPRKAELAAGLAYWASTFHRLPDAPHESAKLTVERAIERVEMVPESRRGTGNIVDRLAPLSRMPSFERAGDLVDFDADLAATLAAITREFARVYCMNAASRDGRIARLHAVTGASALRPIFPFLPASSHRALVRYVWQLDAAVYATHATRDAVAPDIAPFATNEELIAAAIETRDEHAIKLAEVAVREFAITPDRAFQLAAAHWVRANLPD
jgi:hypothetical protein